MIKNKEIGLQNIFHAPTQKATQAQVTAGWKFVTVYNL